VCANIDAQKGVCVCDGERTFHARQLLVRVREPCDGIFSGGAMDWDACSEAASTLEAEECAAYAYTCMCICIYAHIQSNIHYIIHKHIVRVRE
jgi:hypothetical protein